MAGLSFEMCEAGRVVRHTGEHNSLLIVVLTQDLVLAQVETVTHTEPATTRYPETLSLMKVDELHRGKDLRLTFNFPLTPWNTFLPEKLLATHLVKIVYFPSFMTHKGSSP
jgi:hypothetical protein